MNHKDYLFPGTYRNLLELSRKELTRSKELHTNVDFINLIKIRDRLFELGMSRIVANKIVAYISYKIPGEQELKPYSQEERAEIIENICQAILHSFNIMKDNFSFEFAMTCFERAYISD